MYNILPGLFGIVLFLCSCDGNRSTAGGSGTETEATLAGTVLSSTGQPAADVRILLRAGDAREKRIWDSTRTDARGHWEIIGVAAGTWSVEARSSSKDRVWGQQSHVTVAANDSSLEIITAHLQPLDSLHGVLLQADGTPAPAGTEMILLGLGDTARTEPTGEFHFAQISAGAHWIAVGKTILAAHTGTADTLRLDNAVRLDDFDDDVHSIATYQGRWTGAGGWWYALQNDSAFDIMSMLQDDSVVAGNQALHARFAVAKGDWALLGFQAFADSSQTENWCEAKALRLRIRGQGTAHLEIQTAAALAVGDGKTHFSALLDFTPEWQTHTIAMDSLAILGDATGYPDWATACRDVRFVNITVGDTVNIWLDDLYLEK